MRKVVCFLLVLGMITSFGMRVNALDDYSIDETMGNQNEDNIDDDGVLNNQNENIDTEDNFKVNKNENTALEDNNNVNKGEISKDVIIEKANDNTENIEIMQPKLTYSTHVQDIGWTDSVLDGETSGTQGKSKRIEAIKINLLLEESLGNIQYSTFVEDIGWTNYVYNGELSGTERQSKRIEAIKIRLSGDISNIYDVYYRVYIQNTGWLDWTCNDQPAGSKNYDYRIESIEIKLIKKGEQIPSNTENPFLQVGKIFYSTHVENIGWLNNVGDGKSSGTTNQSKRIEAIKIFLDKEQVNGSIEYKTHIQDIGWTNYVSDGTISGTEGQSKRVEAIKIRLKGNIAEQYNVYYRTYIQNFGWLDWAKNDEMSGSEGFSYRIEAIEVVLIEKNESAPGNTEMPSLSFGNVKYQINAEYNGWINEVSDGTVCGTIGQSKRMEAIRILLGENQVSGNIEYSTHVEGIGWMNYVCNGEVSGTEGQSKRMEAIKIRLSGDISKYYDVYYRVHAQDFGWLGWTCNDRVAGTTNGSFRLEAIQIKLYPKNTGPGVDKKSVINFVADGNYKVCQDAFGNIYTDAEPLLGKRSGYTVFTNLSTNIVNVFIADGTGKEIVTYKRYQCTSGAPSTPTIRGTYYIYMKRYYFDSGASRCFYFSPFKGGYGFHTVLCYKDPTPSRIMDGRLGMYLSHGCIRLAIENAKWIYDNCSIGTKVINL